jgi:acyl-CoA thioester hydrolase
MPEAEESRLYRHQFASRVTFGDLDAMGHMNNLALLRLLETGRVDYMVDTGMAGYDELTYVLARLETDFSKQGLFGDNLTCGTRITRLGRTSFTMEQRIWRDDATVLVGSTSVLVALGSDKATPIPVPARWRELIHDWEQRPLESVQR